MTPAAVTSRNACLNISAKDRIHHVFGKVKTLLKYWRPPKSIPPQHVEIGHFSSKLDGDVLLPGRTTSSVVFTQFNQSDQFGSNVGGLCSIPKGSGEKSTQKVR